MKIGQKHIIVIAALAGLGYLWYRNRPKSLAEGGAEEQASGGSGVGLGGALPPPNIKREDTAPAPIGKVPFICPKHPDPNKTYVCSGSKVIGESMKAGSTKATGATNTSAPSPAASKTKLSTIQGTGSTSGGIVVGPSGSIGVGSGPSGNGSVFNPFSGRQPLTIDNLLK